MIVHSTPATRHSAAPRRTPLMIAALGGLLLSPALPLLAQSPGPGTELEFTSSYSGGSDAEFSGLTEGEIAVTAFRASARHSFQLSSDWSLGVGFEYEHFAIDLTGAVPVSDTLRSAALDLSLSWRFAPEWSAALIARPGIYTDGESFDSDGFNTPALLLVHRRLGEDLMLSGGVMFNSFSENIVLPVLAVRWQVTPQTTVTFGAPRTEVAYDFGEGRTVFAGASLQGGAFHTDDPAVQASAGATNLRDTEVSFRELRVGAGLRWSLTETLSLAVEGGWVVDRRFEYDDRDFTVKSDGAAYGQLEFFARF